MRERTERTAAGKYGKDTELEQETGKGWERVMITTLTWNPSLDYTVTVDGFRMGRTNRTQTEQIAPGGKGINVAMVLKELGISSRVLGFVAGFTGREIEQMTGERGLMPEFVTVSGGYSRINVKWKNLEGTELNGMGPTVGREEEEQLYEKLDRMQRGDILVLAGSVSGKAKETAYRDIMERLSGRGIRFVVDASGGLFRRALEAGPFLVKPNHHELGELFGVEISTVEQAAYYGEKLLTQGAEHVLISMGGQGAVLVENNGEKRYQKAPKGRLINAVGAGDSMVAGFLAGWLQSGDVGTALAWGTAAGSASAFCEGLAGKEQITAALKQLEAQILVP